MSTVKVSRRPSARSKVITVRVLRCRGTVTSFEVTGHSGLAPSGEDVLCAAVSAIAQTALLGLQDTPGVVVRDRIRPGDLLCEIQSTGSEEARIRADAITGAMIRGLQNIELTYSQNLKVILSDIEEVSTCS